MKEIDLDNFLYKKQVLEGKENLDEELADILDKYISSLASYSKEEMSEKPDITPEDYYKLKNKVIPEMFPDRSIGLRDLRRSIRVHFYKGNVPDKVLDKDFDGDESDEF